MISEVLEHRLVEGAQVLEGLNDAIEGTSDCGLLVYDYDKLVGTLEKREGMSGSDAMDWIDYNIIGGKAGKGFIVMQSITEEERSA